MQAGRAPPLSPASVLTPSTNGRIVRGLWGDKALKQPDPMGTYMQRRLPPLGAVLALALSAGAAAQEYCVTCTGPDASYRCLIGGEAPPSARSSRGQFLCITELAKAGGHASCSAARGQATPCPGETRTVMFSLVDPGASPLEAAAPPGPQPGAPPAVATPLAPGQELPPVALPPPGQPPATQDAPMETGTAPEAPKPNMVEDLANKTGKAVSDTGKAVGGAVKKSWDCVTSLFGDC